MGSLMEVSRARTDTGPTNGKKPKKVKKLCSDPVTVPDLLRKLQKFVGGLQKASCDIGI
jgi:hypothetical protein